VRERRNQDQKTRATPNKRNGQGRFLAAIDIFRQLDEEDISELERITTTMASPPGRVLYRPGETSNALFILKTGQIQLYHLSTDGRKLIIATLKAGACFGEIALPGHCTHMSFAEVSEEALIYVVNKQDIEPLLMSRPSVTYALFQAVGQRLTQVEMQLVDTTFKSTLARLAALLLHLAIPQEDKAGRLVVDGLSHEELADRLGVYRETVSTALRELKDTGAIELGRKHITIGQPALLANVASTGGKGGLHARAQP